MLDLSFSQVFYLFAFYFVMFYHFITFTDFLTSVYVSLFLNSPHPPRIDIPPQRPLRRRPAQHIVEALLPCLSTVEELEAKLELGEMVLEKSQRTESEGYRYAKAGKAVGGVRDGGFFFCFLLQLSLQNTRELGNSAASVLLPVSSFFFYLDNN
jgi:hypothetical protein